MSESQQNPAPPAGPEDRGFVGRSREMDLLRAALAEAKDGRGQVALLSGEPSIGKTRTDQELARYAETQGFRLRWGWCYDGRERRRIGLGPVHSEPTCSRPSPTCCGARWDPGSQISPDWFRRLATSSAMCLNQLIWTQSNHGSVCSKPYHLS